MRRETLHLTLLFLGEVPRQRIPDLVDAVDKVHGTPFQLSLKEFSCWRHNRIGYAAPEGLPTGLESLVVMLRRQVSAAGFDFDARAYSPHITLLRNVTSPVERLSVPALTWRVQKFALVESVPGSTGVHYVESKSWSLG